MPEVWHESGRAQRFEDTTGVVRALSGGPSMSWHRLRMGGGVMVVELASFCNPNLSAYRGRLKSSTYYG
jgi:hypothetical protein